MRQLRVFMSDADIFDIAVVGGGINGAGIAADAAGRGLRVLLAEQGDLAGGTSSNSSKLIHGGLRYLEHYEFRLVREALAEREVLLAKAPHIIWPMRFVLPHVPGLRPRWMIRSGLLLYDHLYPRARIPASRSVDLTKDPAGKPLAANLTSGFSYWDCWVDDARLVVLNARQAASLGAEICTRTRVAAAQPDGHGWKITLDATGVTREVRARVLVNAAGPWVDAVDRLSDGPSRRNSGRVRLVKGSHVVVPRIPGANDAYLMQSADRRVVFVLPYEERFSIIGTTDVDYTGDPAAVAIDAAEEAYLLDLASGFFRTPIRASEILWRYSGVRPLYDDETADPSAITRDYRLEVSMPGAGSPRLSVYGGKVTTYRRLAEEALSRIAPHLPGMRSPWTRSATLPGGDTGPDFDAYVLDLRARYGWLDALHLRRLARRHGSLTRDVLGDAKRAADLGHHIGEGLYEREIIYLREKEWARTADDVLWRRTKIGLHLATRGTPSQQRAQIGQVTKLID